MLLAYKKYLFISIFCLFCILSLVITGISTYHAKLKAEETYQSAVKLLEYKRYDKATLLLESIPNYLDANNLKSYSRAVTIYNKNDKNTYKSAYYAICDINDSYSGKFSKEALSLKKEIKQSYDVYQKELENVRQKNIQQTYGNSLPYNDMDEAYINSTKLGHAEVELCFDYYSLRPECRYKIIRWYYPSGDLAAYAQVGYSSKNYGKLYGVRIFEEHPTGFTPTTKSTSGCAKNSEYGAEDYSDPEDFYDDHYDDFESYEDAEDYWDEYSE